MRIYLDHNATTPLREEVVLAMAEVLRDHYGNPTSTHTEGARARSQLEEARGQVAACLGVEPTEVYFTAGASEANNSVFTGLTELVGTGRRLVTSQIEHPSVVEPLAELEKAGVPVTWVPVDSDGRIDPEVLFAAADSEAALVSLIWANNETGVVQPIEAIAEGLAERGVPFHVDATQAIGKWPVDLTRVPITYLSCSAHKLNGPKGTGCLVARRGHSFRPLIRGGPQERRLRGGTENVAGIVGFGTACALAQSELTERMQSYGKLRDTLWDHLQRSVPEIRRNGSVEHVLPNTLNVEVPQAPGEVMVQALDLEGVAISMGAACHSGSISPSHVLTAMGLSPEQTRSSLRLSVGHGLSAEDMSRAANLIAEVALRARAAESA